MSLGRAHRIVLLSLGILMAIGLMLLGDRWLSITTGASPADRVAVIPLGMPAPNTLSVSQVGYRPQDAKRGVLLLSDTLPVATFNVMAGEGVVFTGTLQTWGLTWGLTATLADLSAVVTPGYYWLQAGPVTSPHFYIDPYAYRLLDPPDEIIPDAVFPDAIFDSFLAYQRSTAPDLDLPVYTCTTTGELVTNTTWSAPGGWNDAASHDKETASIAWTTHLLALALERNQAYFDARPETRQKLLDEIQWGAEWLRKMQDKDGGMLLAVKPSPPERRVLGNKGTGVTAKAAAALATAARVFISENPMTYSRYLSAAESAWEWVIANPCEFIPPTFAPGCDGGGYPSYWTGKSPSKILATVELYYALRNTDPITAEQYLTQAISDALAGGFVDCAWRDDSGCGQTADFQNAFIEEQTIVALARLYQAPDATPAVKGHIAQELSRWYQGCVTPAISTPYGIADRELLKPWLGLNGWALQLGMDLLVAGEAVDDENMIRTGQDHIHWVVGNNPFATSYVVGVGELYAKDVWYRRPLTASIGAVLPGIFGKEPDGIPDDKVNDPSSEGWKVAEPVVWYTAAFLYDMAWLDPTVLYLPIIQKCWLDDGLMCDGGFEDAGLPRSCWYEWGWGDGLYARDADAAGCARGCSQQGLLLQRNATTKWSGDVVMHELDFESGNALQFCSWMSIPNDLPHGETYLEIVFKDSDDKALDRLTGSKYRRATGWVYACIDGVAPARTSKAQVYFVAISWPGTGINHVCYDDAWANVIEGE